MSESEVKGSPPPPEFVLSALSNLASIVEPANAIPLSGSTEIKQDELWVRGLETPHNPDGSSPATVRLRHYKHPQWDAELNSVYNGLNEETNVRVNGEVVVKRSASGPAVSDAELEAIDNARVVYQPFALNPGATPSPESGVTKGDSGAIIYTSPDRGIVVIYEPVGHPLKDMQEGVGWGGRDWKESIKIGDQSYVIEGRTVLNFPKLSELSTTP